MTYDPTAPRKTPDQLLNKRRIVTLNKELDDFVCDLARANGEGISSIIRKIITRFMIDNEE